VSVLGEIGAFVRGHAGEEVFDEVVRDEGVAEIEFGYVRLLGGGLVEILGGGAGGWMEGGGEMGIGERYLSVSDFYE